MRRRDLNLALGSVALSFFGKTYATGTIVSFPEVCVAMGILAALTSAVCC
jgi:hypothetical protein